MSKAEERFVVLRVPEDIAQSVEPMREVRRACYDREMMQNGHYVKKALGQLGRSARLITLDDALCEKALNAFEGVKAPRDFEDMRAALRVAFGEEGSHEQA